ncbi:DDE-type integrase/transposase/recombinase, partial [Aduncisulcus paluster]
FVVITPLKSLRADEIARSLFTNIFSLHGPPNSIRSDGGFVNETMVELAKLCSIDWITTLPYNHEENGLVERLNREIRRLTRIYFMDHDSPDYLLDSAALTSSLNSRVHSSTGVSPYSAIFGTHRRLSSIPPNPRPSLSISKEIIHDLDERLRKIRGIMENTQEEVYKKQDAKVSDTDNFIVDELVLLAPPKAPKKHVPVLKGPFRISSFLSDKFSLRPLDGGKIFTVPRRRLRKYNPGDEDEAEMARISAKDEEEFSVEKILSKRFGGKKKIEFKVRWEGYGPEEDSWLSWKEVKDLEVLDKFLDENPRLKERIEKGNMKL